MTAPFHELKHWEKQTYEVEGGAHGFSEYLQPYDSTSHCQLAQSEQEKNAISATRVISETNLLARRYSTPRVLHSVKLIWVYRALFCLMFIKPSHVEVAFVVLYY